MISIKFFLITGFLYYSIIKQSKIYFKQQKLFSIYIFHE